MQDRSKIDPFVLCWWEYIEKLSHNIIICNCFDVKCIKLLEQYWKESHNLTYCMEHYSKHSQIQSLDRDVNLYFKPAFIKALSKQSKMAKILYGE